MYLMGFVNSTFETRRSTGNLELVDLKYHPPEPVLERRKEHRDQLSNGHSQNCPQNCSMIRSSSNSSSSNGNGTVTSTKIENGNSNGPTATLKTKLPIARPRRTSLEDLPADLYMEPLSPLLLRSSEGVGSRGLRLQNSSWLPEETSVHWLKEDLESGGQELDQEWSFCIGKQRKYTTSTAWRMTTTRLASTFESVFADGGISIRVQHHPLESAEEDQGTEKDQDRDSSDASEESKIGDTIAGSSDREFCDKIGPGDANIESLPKTDEGFAQMLQHLESIEEDSVKDRKLPSTNLTEGNGLQQLAREDDAKLGIEQSELHLGLGVPIAAPLSRSSKLGGGNYAEPRDLVKLPSLSPSLSSPVMEKMNAAISSEFPYSWNKKLPNQPMREERDLRYPTPKMTKSDDAQDELSFRMWEPEPTPKRGSRDFQELENSQDSDFLADEYASYSKDGGDDSMEIVKIPRKLSPPNVDALLNLRTFDLRSRRRATTPKVDVDVGLNCEEDEDEEQDYPSPSSFTCGLSPTSLFSDDQEPFRLSVSSSDENMFPVFQKLRSGTLGSREGITASKSPRSVLSQEPDEISHFTSDSSETGKKHRKQTSVFKYLYNDDESSELESPMKAKTTVVKHQPFPAFTYSVGKLDMGGTSSDEDPDRDLYEARDDARNGNVAHLAESLQKLGLFQDLNHREPWLVNDGGVLDDSEDLEFLFSPDSKRKDTASLPLHEETSSNLRSPHEQVIQSPASEEIPEMEDLKTIKHDSSPRRPKWVPYVTGSLHSNDPPTLVRNSRPHGKASVAANVSRDESEKAPKRSVNFAPDLVKEIPYSSTPAHQPAAAPRANHPKVKHIDEEPAGKKTWEVEEEEGPSIMTSRRRWRRNRDEDSKSPGGSTRWRRNQDEDSKSLGGSTRWWRNQDVEDSKSPSGSTRWWRNQDVEDSKSPGGSRRSSWSFAETRSRSRERVAQVVPCAGKLFSWPRRFACKVSKSRPVDSDDDRSFVGDQSFGMSSRRDAELVRRILKGSQKKYSNLTGADIMREDFGY